MKVELSRWEDDEYIITFDGMSTLSKKTAERILKIIKPILKVI